MQKTLSLLEPPREPIEAPDKSSLTTVRAVWRQEGRDRRLDDGRARELLTVGEIGDLLQELRREVDVHPVTHRPPQSPSPSAGSSAACRARPRICWLSTRACWTLSSVSSVTVNSLLGADTVVSLAIARWSGRSGSRRSPLLAVSSRLSVSVSRAADGLRSGWEDHSSGAAGSDVRRSFGGGNMRSAKRLSSKYRAFFALIGGHPDISTSSSLGGSCMTSPAVRSGRAVSWRETMRWPSQGDSRCPA